MREFCDERMQMRNIRLDRIFEEPMLLNEIAALPLGDRHDGFVQ